MKLPTKIDNCPVWADTDNKSTTHTGVWVSLYPNDPRDRRAWEFDKITGRIIQTIPRQDSPPWRRP